MNQYWMFVSVGAACLFISGLHDAYLEKEEYLRLSLTWALGSTLGWIAFWTLPVGLWHLLS